MTLSLSTVENQLLLAEQTLAQCVWPRLEAIEHHCFARVLEAFTRHRVGEEHFYSVSGYGHDDLGREVTDAVFADALQAEAALVRMQIVSGTHAIAVALNGCLRHGDTLLSITGRPYDTLEEVIGIRGDQRRSLTGQGVTYREISVFDHPPEPGGVRLRFTESEAAEIRQATVIFIQRSRGYSNRPSLTIAQLEALIGEAKRLNPAVIVMTDNCYGEFTDFSEPPAVGADLIAGSLIKNPGGGVVPTGGYVAGRADLVAQAADVLTCPGIGADGGFTFDLTRSILQGLFLAPSTVKEALKGMTLAAYLLTEAGYDSTPTWQEPRSDIIQMIHLKAPDKLVRFCQLIQAVSPIASNIVPIPAKPPGYSDEVVMAGGTFIDGSTLELSADGPLREPYTAYLQGGLTYAHTRYAMGRILSEL